MFSLRFIMLSAGWLSAGVGLLSAQSVLPVSAAIQQFREQGGHFEQVTLFTSAPSRAGDALRFAPKAQFLSLDKADLPALNASLPKALTIHLPYHGEILTVDLLEASVFTPDFSVVTDQSDGRAVPYIPAKHYRGAIRGDGHSLAAFSFCAGEIMGLISDDHHGDMVLGRLDLDRNAKDYILYADNELSEPNPFTCEPLDTGLPDSKPGTAHPEVSGCVRAYWECDNELFQNKGSVQATVDYLAGAFNELATLYANEQISTMLSQIFVWVSPDNYSVSSSSSALTQFKALRTSYNGDIAHLVGIGGNNLGGIAYVDVLCAPGYAYAFSDISASYSTVPTYSWTVEVLTHEMGHNLGSPHTQSCSWPGGALDNCFTTEGGCPPGPAPVNGGTIMSYCHLTNYGINFNNGFGTLPGNKIRTEVSGASCLAASCSPVGSCAAPSDISISNVNGSSADVAWNSVGNASGYTVQWRPVGAVTWAAANNVASPYSITGLPANDEIEVRIQSLCGSSSSEFSYGVIFVTNNSGGGGGGGTSCGVPAKLAATVTSANSAIIGWGAVSGATGYQLSYKPASSSSWGIPVNLSTTAYTLNNLAAKTSYNVQVAAVCTNSTSGFAATTFTTPASGGGGSSCGVPGNLSASAVTYSSANINWNQVTGASYYQLYYKQASAYYWSNVTLVYGTAYFLKNLQANTIYNVRIRAVCASGNSAYITTNFITTSPGGGGGSLCAAPSNFLLNAVSATSAIISWSPLQGALGYDLQIKLASSSSWLTFVNLPATVVQITNLKPGTTYQARVRTRCSGTNNYSNYTNILSITTSLNIVEDEGLNRLSHGEGLSVSFTDKEIFSTEPGSALQVYPNPSSGIVHIVFESEMAAPPDLGVFDLNGRRLSVAPLFQDATTAQLDLQGLPAGVYWLRAVVKDRPPLVKRLVKE